MSAKIELTAANCNLFSCPFFASGGLSRCDLDFCIGRCFASPYVLIGTLQKYRLEVGSMCFPALVGILENDRNHSELLSMALDTLAVVITESDETDGEEDVDELGEKFAQIFIKDKRPASFTKSLSAFHFLRLLVREVHFLKFFDLNELKS